MSAGRPAMFFPFHVRLFQRAGFGPRPRCVEQRVSAGGSSRRVAVACARR